MPPSNLARLRKTCLALPEAKEIESWGSPTFRIGKIFAMYAAAGDHHGAGREAVWVKTDHFTQDLLVHAQPSRYFSPPYVGPAGWTGVYLERGTDWVALVDLLRDAYCRAAPKKLAAMVASEDSAPIPEPRKSSPRKSAPRKRMPRKKAPATKRARKTRR